MANFGNGGLLAEDSGGWVAGDDPEDIETTDFTAEGDDYWYAQYVHVDDGGRFSADYEDVTGWMATDISLEEGHDLIKVSGTYQDPSSMTNTVAKRDALKEFFRNHSSIGDSTFYWIRRYDEDLYDKFPNQNRTMKKYVPVRFTGVPTAKIRERVLYFSFTLRSMWGA